MKRKNRNDSYWTEDQGVNTGLFLFRITALIFAVLLVIILLVGLVVDLWRFWYGTLILLVSGHQVRWLLLGPINSRRVLQIFGIVLAVSFPYALTQIFINLGYTQFLTEGIGVWKCHGDYQWFWHAMENCPW